MTSWQTLSSASCCSLTLKIPVRIFDSSLIHMADPSGPHRRCLGITPNFERKSTIPFLKKIYKRTKIDGK
ncbi:hypothetical protein HPP92_016590 [Vanilla planifolia]|uniref:Uncharacterized protein n=1 Tax=Vanilla planifolia TaxID=51239 RepID=A0A835QFZ4_VANPL|nr:hypothetical protein HPP92_016590 [Vanilla planifolia]